VEDLEAAAKDALDRLQGLTARIDQAEERLVTTRQQVDRAGDQLEDDWQALTRQFDAFFQAVDSAQARLREDGEEARQALGAAELAVTGAAEATSSVEEERGGVEALGDQVESRGPAVSEKVEQARAAHQRLSQRAAATEQQLGQALSDARDFLQGEVLTDLQQMQQAVQQRRQALRGAVSECEGDLDTALDGWRHGLDELRVTVDRAFDDVGQQVERMVKEAVSEVAPVQRAALEELSAHAETLAQALSRLADVATQRSAEIGDGVGALEEEAATTAAALDTMQDRLAEVRELLARCSFVSF